MFLPAVVSFNASAESMTKENRLHRMAHAMGLSSGTDVTQALTDMNHRLGLPTGLEQMGVSSSMFAQIITGAQADHCHKTNPRIASLEDYSEMLLRSM
jgi:alcohol dehydrogenase class IV